MLNKLRWRLVPLYAAAVFLTYPVWQGMWNEYTVSSATEASQTKLQSATGSQEKIEGLPSRIIIPRFSIDLAVVPGSYDEHQNKWSVSENSANHATNTAQANNYSGQTLIYGHNNKAVLGPLLMGFKPQDKVYIHTSNGHVFEYEFIGSTSIEPTATGILKELKTGTGLKIITCEGSDFEYRNVMSFKLKKAA